MLQSTGEEGVFGQAEHASLDKQKFLDKQKSSDKHNSLDKRGMFGPAEVVRKTSGGPSSFECPYQFCLFKNLCLYKELCLSKHLCSSKHFLYFKQLKSY